MAEVTEGADEGVAERTRRWVRMHLDERMSFAEIGRVEGFSRQYVHQKVRDAGVTPEDTAASRPDPPDPEPAEPHVPERRYSDEDLLDHLRELGERLGHTPRQADLQEADGPSVTVYYRRFGTLTRAQELAGLVPNERGGGPGSAVQPLPEDAA